MNKKEAQAFCEKWLAAWSSHDAKHLLGFYAPEAFYRDPGRPDGLSGHDELAIYFEKRLRANPWVWNVEEVIPTENGFVLKWRAIIEFEEIEHEETGLDIVDVEGGLITRNEVYFDRAAIMNRVAG